MKVIFSLYQSEQTAALTGSLGGPDVARGPAVGDR